jgi:conjugal transfer pilus assembly protein TraF
MIFAACLSTVSVIADSFAVSKEKSASYFDDRERGWHWYERESRSEEKKNDSQPAPPLSPLEKLKQYQENLETAKAEAVLNPTPQNVLNYQRLQYELMEKSAKFADVWMHNVYLYPEIDHTLKVPVSQKARHIYLREKEEAGERKIAALSKKYGLFLFLQSNCRYCEAFSPIVKRFSEKYGWEVLAVSENGEQSKEFERSVKDNGLADAWKVNIYPSLFAVNPKTGHVIPVAVGMISVEEMEERIAVLSEEENEKRE